MAASHHPQPSTAHTAAPKAQWLRALLALLLCCTLAPPAAQAAAPQRSTFDHLTTGFELLGQHRDLPCESCHVNAIFKGTPKNCSACHGVGTTVRATAKPTSHIMSTDQCDSCHTEVAWKPSVTFDHKQALGSCSSCHNGVQAQGKPPNHIVTDLECDACHTTVSWAGAMFTHLGVTSGCAQCHNNVSAQGMPSNHIPIGTPPTPCEACHSNTNFTNWLGAKINHPAVAAMQCASCHGTAAFLGMHPSTSSTAGDSRPPTGATYDPSHPTTGDCVQCHDTTTFLSSALRPANHIPTNAVCSQCHTTPGNYALYDVVGVHQGLTTCLACHGPNTGPFAGPPPSNTITILSWPVASHIPIGSPPLDCGSSGCHTTANVNPKGFFRPASITAPTLGAAGHGTVSGMACLTCHEQNTGFLGMVASTASPGADTRPNSYLPSHPAAPQDCKGCHTTTPTFGNNQSSNALPTGHIPVAPPTYAAQPACTTCHTTPGNFAQYSVSAVHQGVNGCAACHGSSVGPFLNVTIVTTAAAPGTHIPIGSGPTAVDCNGAGCHTANGGVSGGFKLPAASPTAPFFGVQAHATVAAGVSGCAVCHETANFAGMVPSTSAAWGDSRPTAYDPNHPTQAQAPECGTCHTTTPTFMSNMTAGSLPANHIPIAPPVYTAQPACTTCHGTPNNYAQYSVGAVHQGVNSCNACHASNVNTTFKNVTPLTTPSGPNGHIPIGAPGALDCGSSGCHVSNGGVTGGFKIGTASLTSLNNPTLTGSGHTSVQAVVPLCATCHQSANFMGMVASTNTAPGDSRPNATLDLAHTQGQLATSDCGVCHIPTPTFASNMLCGTKQLPVCTSVLPTNHIPTNGAVCAQCHTTAGNFAVYSVIGVHQGATTCNSCHGMSAGTLGPRTFLGPPPSNTITIQGLAATHIPTGAAPGVDCGSSGCHTTANVNPGGFFIRAASITTPTLNIAGHNSIGAGAGCQGCHQSAQYVGMLVGTSMSAMGDDRPTYDANHPASGDCNGCHSTTPTFASNQTGNNKPANHIPTSAPMPYATAPACATCHTTVGNNTVYSVTAVHQNLAAASCLTCHASNVAGTFANVSIKAMPANHIPTGAAPGVDCGSSGCHTTANVNPGGFFIRAASITAPTLDATGHNSISASSGCQGCHESAKFVGMVVGTSMSAQGDDRPMSYDGNHPSTGDCKGCHNTTTPTFATNQTGNNKPANHIPTSAPMPYTTAPACATCHTTAGNNTVYSVAAVHQNLAAASCLTCHASNVAGTFANVSIKTMPAGHIPVGTLDCSSSGCHVTNGGAAGGFKIGAASITVPTLGAAGHGTVSAMTCLTCHEQNKAFVGMIPSTASPGADTRPNSYLPSHPAAPQDCKGCHTTTPTFYSNQTGGSKPANHIPTNASCGQCHTTAGNYAAYVMGATGHTGITNNCAQCHAYGLSFYNMAPPTLKEPPSGATGHIPCVPPNGTIAIACELCHSPTVFTTFSGTIMKHAYVTSMKCMSCHEYNMRWKTNSGVQLWTRPDPSHHAGQDCGGSGCHTSRDKYVARGATPRQTTPTTTATARGAPPATSRAGTAAAGASTTTAVSALRGRPERGVPAAAAAAGTPFDHSSVTGTACVTCHSGASAGGKPAGHITSSNACQSCHTTLAWLPVARVDHTQVLGSCASCHNGSIATGKPSSHLPTTAACESCHTTNAWTPARFDHGAVTAHSCTSCHNGLRAAGLPRAHIPTTQSCDTCHGTLAWTPVKVDHAHLTATCVSCHNNIGAVGFSPGHLRTQLDCARCHNYPDFGAVTFRHRSSAYPAGRHAKLACTSCHTTNTDQVPYVSATEAGSCAGCHAKDFKPAAHPKTAKGMSYSAHELADCTGACHVYGDTTQSTITKSLPGPHHRATDATLKR